MKTLLVVLVAALSFGQATAPPAPPSVKATQSITADQPSQISILKAQHALDDLQKKGADIQLQWDATQRQQQDLQKQYQDLTPKLEAAKKAKKDAVDAGAKAIGIDPAKYDFKDEDLTYIPKPEPVPATPSPVKK